MFKRRTVTLLVIYTNSYNKKYLIRRTPKLFFYEIPHGLSNYIVRLQKFTLFGKREGTLLFVFVKITRRFYEHSNLDSLCHFGYWIRVILRCGGFYWLYSDISKDFSQSLCTERGRNAALPPRSANLTESPSIRCLRPTYSACSTARRINIQIYFPLLESYFPYSFCYGEEDSCFGLHKGQYACPRLRIMYINSYRGHSFLVHLDFQEFKDSVYLF